MILTQFLIIIIIIWLYFFFSFWCANYFTSLLQAPNFVGGTFGISLQPLLNISNHTLIEKSQVHITVNYLQ